MVSGKQEFGGSPTRAQVNNKSVAMLFALLGMALFVATSAGFAVSLNQTGDPLNYYYHKTHNVTVTIGGITGADFYVNVTIPTGWTITGSSSGSVQISANHITWHFTSAGGYAGSELVYYTMTSPGTSVAELAKSTMASSYNHSTQADPVAGQNLTFVRIADTKVMDILEELGRGQGNYPYSTRYGGTQYIPASTTTQLYFLNRIYNIAQYLANTTELAQSVTMFCDYPTYPAVTYHLVSALTKGTSTWQANYSISEIEPSWWRMGYIGLEISNLAAGTQIHVNCTDLRYSFAHGIVRVANQTFNLSAATITPMTVTAAPSNNSIMQGQTEVDIQYNISNSGPYDIDSPEFELKAPNNSKWIGVRGELWGEAREKYVFSLPRLLSASSFNITLVARFDVSNAGANNLGNLTTKFVPVWATTAYNPSELTQTVNPSNTITVSANTGAVISTIMGELRAMRDLANAINSTANSINITVNNINSTIYDLNNTVRYTMVPLLTDIGRNVTLVNNTVKEVRALVDCTNSTWGTVCNKLDNITYNLDNVNGTVLRINNSVNRIEDMQTNEQFRRFRSIEDNITLARDQIVDIKGYLNCTTNPTSSVCNKLDNVTSIVDLINTTTKQAFVITQFINTSRWGNFTAADIFNRIQAAIVASTSDTLGIQSRIGNLKELTQEAVFLVTDSVGLQTEARADFEKGDISAAVSKLEKASSNLAEANAMVEAYMKTKSTAGSTGTAGTGTGTGMTGNAGLGGIAGIGSAGVVIAILLVGIVAGSVAPRLMGSFKLGERLSALRASGRTTPPIAGRGRQKRRSARKKAATRRTTTRKTRARK